MNILSYARSTVGGVTRHSDLVLVVMMVAVIAMIILPLPTQLVDFLIGANLAMSFTLIMLTMYVGTALEFSSFPTLLLFTTLFRLGLNITTTRLILLQADAGKIIFTFGNFAVGGDFVVGAVVFIIITIVQFVVIAKGAERVSEVGARFTLDAMPGKQMSIDADLRAGVIDMEEAQLRRDTVARESQMYGAMDGAMKFVKGDSIAGLIIAVVNIVAGTLIGSLRNGLSAMESLELYGILTIGDGLVSQIPSLLVAISAGVLVTRAGGKAPKDPPKYLTASGNNVGAQIGSQFFSHPKALKVAGVLVFLFALVPGFPKPQLFALALFLIGLGYALSKVANAPEDVDYKKDLSITSLAATTPKIPKKPLTQGTAYREEFAPVIPIILDISPQMGETFRYDVFNEELASLRRALYFDLGVPFPGINLRPSPTLPGLSYIMNLNEIPLSRGTLEINKVLVIDNEDNLLLLGIKAFKGPDFIQGLNSLWVSEDKITILEKMGLKFLNHPKIVSYHLSLILSRHASNFLGLQETKYLLDKMEERAPDLVRELTRLLPLHRFTEILQRLVQEEVSIRDLRAIMESLIEWVPKEKDSIMLVEYVRGSLRRQISYKYTVGSNILPVIIIDQGVEETIRKSIRQTSAGTFLSLDPQVTKAFLSELSKAHKGVKGHLSGGRCAVLASIDIRRYVRRLIEADHYELPVISYQELTSEITVQPVDKIKL